MDLHVQNAPLQGAVEIPGSKSHTIRAVAIAAMAEGESEIRSPLESADARAAFSAYRAFGATITEEPDLWRVQGTGPNPKLPDDIIDTGNSGTTMNIALGTATLVRGGLVVLTGDEQVRRRPCGPLAQSLNDLGASVRATRGGACPPYVVEGPLRGGSTTIEAMTSQYVTSLLMAGVLAEADSRILVPLMHEKPYVTMTLDWLERQGVKVAYDADYTEFHIPGGQRYQPVRRRIPGDFSSATFFLAAGAMLGNDVLSNGLDMSDTQGDKAVVDYLRQMGAVVSVEGEGIRVTSSGLKGCEIDLNATPDALPMMAALACFAEGTTRLVNVPQARLKETDRITVMRLELEKLGAKIEELEDGLVVHGAKLHAGHVEGHGDHRVVMSLAMAASQIPGETVIHGAEAMRITFPTFVEAIAGLGGVVKLV